MAAGDFGDLENLLNSVNQNLEKNQIEGSDGAFLLFGRYIDMLLEMRLFSVMEWPLEWRLKHSVFFRLFRHSPRLASQFLQLIDQKQANIIQKEEREPLHYLRLGIMYYGLDDNHSAAAEYAFTVVKQYPGNSEFCVFRALCLSAKGENEKALSAMYHAMVLEKHTEHYLNDLMKVETNYLSELISENRFVEADRLLTKMQDYYIENFSKHKWALIHRQILLFKNRLEDHRQVHEKMENIEILVVQKTEKERRRLVEVLGVFSAILAFIFMNIELVTHFNLQDAFWLMLTMADVLLIFAVSLSYFFRNLHPVPFYKRERFMILVGLLVGLFFIGIAIHSGGNFSGQTTVKESTGKSPTFHKLFIPKK